MTRDGRNILTFVALAYGLAWVLLIPLLLESFHLHHFGRSLPFFGLTASFAPSFAAVFLTRRSTGRWMPSPLLPPARHRRIVLTLVPSALILLGFILLPLLVSAEPIHLHLSWTTFAALLALWPNIISGPLGEEAGWRGFLQPRLSEIVGPAPAALLTGIVWSLWHLPLFFVQGWDHPRWWIFGLVLTAASVILAYGFNLSGGSILAAILGHFTLNRSSGILHALGNTIGHPILHEDAVLLGSVAITAVVLILATKGRLADANIQRPPLGADRLIG
jgi:uncharacterized protein